MTKKHIAEYFQKSLTIANNILTDIWHNSVSDNLLVINDFVKHKSYDVLSLNVQEIRRIHRINAKHSRRKSTYNSEFELDSGRANMCIDNFNLQDGSATRSKDNVPMFMSPWTPDTLITDDLLDSFNIPLGKKKERLNKFYKYSDMVYNYLCYHIGSERNVKLRRWFQQKKYAAKYDNGRTVEVSGSKAEGLDMKGSDTDLMVVVGDAYEHYALSTPNTSSTRMNFKFSNIFPPGYVLVETVTSGKYVSSSEFKYGIFGDPMVHKKTLHGPSWTISSDGMEIDIVPTLQCETWPEVAKEWIVRERKFGWPSQEMINNIVKQGCCIVPVGTKVNNAIDAGWRLSFSLAEKDLIFSFNHTQLLVYGLLKLILNDIVKPKKEVSELLCSYFLKTTLFWIIEETQSCVWKHQLIILCFHLCLERLIQFIAEENCPNYFVRINNMFAGRFSVSGKEKLLHIFCDISTKGLNWFLQSETMYKLMYCIQGHFKLHGLRLLQKRKDLIEIAKLVLGLIVRCTDLSFSAFGSKKRFYIPSIKQLLKVPILKTSFRTIVCHFIDTSRITNDNKTANSLQKLHLFLLRAGCNTDLAAGKLTFASWLYNNGKYIESLELAYLALEFSKFRIFHASGRQITTYNCNLKNIVEPKINLIQNLHRFATSDVYFHNSLCLLPSEVFYFYWPNSDGFNFYPECYSFFLQFLCLRRLGQTKLSHDALLNIQHVKHEGTKYEKILHNLMNMRLRFVGNRIENIPENEWRNDASSVILPNASHIDFKVDRNCAPFLAELFFWYSYEDEFLESLLKKKEDTHPDH